MERTGVKRFFFISRADPLRWYATERVTGDEAAVGFGRAADALEIGRVWLTGKPDRECDMGV